MDYRGKVNELLLDLQQSILTLMHIDQKYILFLKNNDSLGIANIYEQYAPSVVGMILKNNGSEEEAYDILQESLIDIYHISLKPDFILTTSFSNFLMMVCKRKWLNVLRQKKSRQVTNIDESLYTLEDTSQADYSIVLERNEKENIVMDLVENMGKSCRDIIKKCMDKTLGQKEIARKLGISYAYLRKKKSECMKSLANMVKVHPYFKKHGQF